MTLEQAAAEINLTKSTVSRMETAQASSRPAIVQALLIVYGVTGSELRALIQLAKEANQPGWWRAYSDVLPSRHLDHIALETEASAISTFEPTLVPGLLQTADYARAVMQSGVNTLTEQEIERRVEARLTRQTRLASEAPPTLCAILDETALRRPVGDRVAVMRPQLDRLLELLELPNVTIQIVPLSAGAHPGINGSVTILEFPDPLDPSVAFLETIAGDLYLDKPADLRVCTKVFDALRTVALGPEESRATISASIDSA